MERKGLKVEGYPDLDNLTTNYLNDGWVLDPLFKSNPVKLDSMAFYHLIKYSEEEQKEIDTKILEEETLKMAGKFDDVIGGVQVPYNEIEQMVEEGFVMEDKYAKHVTMLKRKAEKDEK